MAKSESVRAEVADHKVVIWTKIDNKANTARVHSTLSISIQNQVSSLDLGSSVGIVWIGQRARAMDQLIFVFTVSMFLCLT